MNHFWMNVGILLLVTSGLDAQQPSENGPVVTTTAEAQVRRAPDYATVAIGVATLDSTATGAANSMNTTLETVFDTLVALGISRDSLPTRHFTIRPEYAFDGQRRLVGFSANASVTVTVADLPNLGIVIAGALAAGANDVGSITFGLREDRTARNEALTMAVEQARLDAAALAAASGTRLGPLREIRTGFQVASYGPGVEGGVRIRGAQSVEAAQVTPTDVLVTATVTATWHLRN